MEICTDLYIYIYIWQDEFWEFAFTARYGKRGRQKDILNDIRITFSKTSGWEPCFVSATQLIASGLCHLNSWAASLCRGPQVDRSKRRQGPASSVCCRFFALSFHLITVSLNISETKQAAMFAQSFFILETCLFSSTSLENVTFATDMGEKKKIYWERGAINCIQTYFLMMSWWK